MSLIEIILIYAVGMTVLYWIFSAVFVAVVTIKEKRQERKMSEGAENERPL